MSLRRWHFACFPAQTGRPETSELTDQGLRRTKLGDNQAGLFEEGLKTMVRKVILGIFTMLAAAYGADDLMLRYKLAHHEPVFGNVEVDHYQIVPLKGGKNEYDFTGSEQVTCVYALFPHADDAPCWYLSKHREKRENL